MKVFTDYISGDEFLSDSFPHEFTFNDACIEAKAKYMTKGNDNICISPEDEDEMADEGGETVVDIPDKMCLVEIQGWGKSDFMTWARGYLQKTMAKLTELGKEERIPGFKKGATQLIKLIAGQFDEFQLYSG